MENLRLITVSIPETNRVPGIVAEKGTNVTRTESSFIPSQQETEKSIDKVVSFEELKQEIEKEASTANRLMRVLNNKIKYVVDERSRTGLVVQIINNESGELIKQLPPEELLELLTRLKDDGIGVHIDNNG